MIFTSNITTPIRRNVRLSSPEASLETFVKKESTDTVNGNFFIDQDTADFLKAKTPPADPSEGQSLRPFCRCL
jgi:hypothetical protein